ncbi:TetR/AcrR family transcriptional regulator [Microbacterium sp. NPDC057650]|uniref:TetR/AcrR family transcriptional regulator n=1 Tax=unclassified Microbacterium TaxID=2609290 RepID=UPI00366A70E5
MEERQLEEITPAVVLPTWDATQSRVLDAADEVMVRRGVHDVTIAELARRAEVSRPTIYRSWSDADDVVRTALLRRAAGILARFPARDRDRDDVVEDVLRFIRLFRGDEVYGRLLAEEPEAFTRYTLQRVGSSQRMIIGWLAQAIDAAQQGGTVRKAPAQEIAVMLLLVAQSAVLSHGTVAELIDEDAWERELRAALDGLLRP